MINLIADGQARDFTTVEAAAVMLMLEQPAEVAVNGIVIDSHRRWSDDTACEAIATAMSASDWYWLDGSAYCPACVECIEPAIDVNDPNVQRGGDLTYCPCCGTDYSN